MRHRTEHRPFDDGFIVESGQIRVSDPCYTPDTWCASVFKAKNGRWLAALDIAMNTGWGDRVEALIIHHESVPNPNGMLQSEITVGVDSGQCGFYDEGKYETIFPKSGGADGTGRYEEMGELTLGKAQGGVFDCGVVSSSGFGDGSYVLYTQSNEEGEVVAAKVVFIQEDEEEDEDQFDETEDDESSED